MKVNYKEDEKKVEDFVWSQFRGLTDIESTLAFYREYYPYATMRNMSLDQLKSQLESLIYRSFHSDSALVTD